MAIYKRGKTYWYEFVFEGRRVRASAKMGNRRAAEQIEAAKKVQLAKREVDLDVEKDHSSQFPGCRDRIFELVYNRACR